ncbi:antigen WC1.1-like isoform X5 [Mustela erminea]|uniref:antigen WC1.1-like isoform X5 n=1 Tax=Mustela erminea TaxID=36723 RepID=UPI0013868E35|nr:antigen WC1.1-like isoform X5 [Mustela erminea]
MGVRMALNLSLQGLCVLLSTMVAAQITELRLVNGSHRCEGRVEVKYKGKWGTVYDYRWYLQAADVVCKQLECGHAIDARRDAYFGRGVGPIWLVNTVCKGTKPTLNDCSHDTLQDYRSLGLSHSRDAGVVCSGFVRLAGGDGPCLGRVEVHSGKDWVPLSDGNFTLLTAQVICAELGCGKAVSFLGDMSIKESYRVWPKEFQCKGHEPELWFCHNESCPGDACHRGAVQVFCSVYTEVRLMKNGISQCEGQVEMHISGQWKTLCASHWNMANANVVCQQLGCGVAVSTPKGAYFVEGGDKIWEARFHCSGAESFLWNCPVTALGIPSCTHGNTASVICSGNQTQVLPQCNDSVSEPEGSAASQESAATCSDSRQLRLVDGGGPCAGRVEILHQGSWGTICDDSWDLSDAHVVCRQLGCGEALNATVSAHFGEGSDPIWLDDLECTGKESHIWKCPSRGWGQHDCRHKEDAGVICSDFLKLRVVSEDQECAGWLEVFYNGTWGSVCHSPMADITLSIICRHLGCGDSGTVSDSIVPREGSRPRWVDQIQCRKTDSSLWQCPSDPWRRNSCFLQEEAYISCAGVRPRSCPTAAACTGGRTSLQSPAGGIRQGPNLVRGIFSLSEMLCFFLGALLFLVLVILVIQMYRWRAKRRALPSFEDVPNEAVYEEIDYLVATKEDLLGSTGALSDDSVTKLPYYTGDGEDNTDFQPAPGSRAQKTDAPSEDYDNVEEVPVPEAPFASWVNEGELPPGEENVVRASPTGSSLQFSRGIAGPGKEEASPWLLQGEEGDPGYDDVELNAPQTSTMVFS